MKLITVSGAERNSRLFQEKVNGKQFKNHRRMYFPDGEGIAAMQARAMTTVHELAQLPQTKVGIIVSHGDVIKSIVASALGMHLDEFQRIIIDPASVTIIEYSSLKPRLLLLNDTRGVVTDLLLAPKRSKNLIGGGSGK